MNILNALVCLIAANTAAIHGVLLFDVANGASAPCSFFVAILRFRMSRLRFAALRNASVALVTTPVSSSIAESHMISHMKL